MRKLKDVFMIFLATGGFLGYSPFMRGTLGTLLGVIIFIFLSSFQLFYYILVAIFLIVSIPISMYVDEKLFKEKDSQNIVIDEIVGFLIATLGFTFTPDVKGIILVLLLFITFRFLDILKPYPIFYIQNIQHGISVVLDDVLAGIITNISIRILIFTDLFGMSTLLPVH